MAAAFGAVEQLEIWHSSAKDYEDFERLVIGMGTNVPGAVGYGLMPKKWFDDHFDRGPNEAEILRKLLDAEKRLSSVLKPVEDAVMGNFDANEKVSSLSHVQREVVLSRVKENVIKSLGVDPLKVESGSSHCSDEMSAASGLAR